MKIVLGLFSVLFALCLVGFLIGHKKWSDQNHISNKIILYVQDSPEAEPGTILYKCMDGDLGSSIVFDAYQKTLSVSRSSKHNNYINLNNLVENFTIPEEFLMSLTTGPFTYGLKSAFSKRETGFLKKMKNAGIIILGSMTGYYMGIYMADATEPNCVSDRVADMKNSDQISLTESIRFEFAKMMKMKIYENKCSFKDGRAILDYLKKSVNIAIKYQSINDAEKLKRMSVRSEGLRVIPDEGLNQDHYYIEPFENSLSYALEGVRVENPSIIPYLNEKGAIKKIRKYWKEEFSLKMSDEEWKDIEGIYRLCRNYI